MLFLVPLTQQGGQEGNSIYRIWYLRSAELRQCGHHVGKVAQVVRRGARFDLPWPANEIGHSQTAFQELALAEGAANASILAGGIWQALLTTAAGLVVAIPSAVAASLLGTRVERVGTAMETTVGRLMALDETGRDIAE